MTGPSGEVSADADSGVGRLFAIAGPSGVGKSTIVAEAVRKCPRLWLSVSTTTRCPRAGEQSGREYDFVSPEVFADLRLRGELLESAEFAGNWYGTPLLPVKERLMTGQDVLLEIDLAGVRQVRAAMPDAVTIFIAPPSRDELVRRLAGRGTEDATAVEARLGAAVVELAAADEFDYRIVNSDLESAVDELLSLVGCAAPNV